MRSLTLLIFIANLAPIAARAIALLPPSSGPTRASETEACADRLASNPFLDVAEEVAAERVRESRRLADRFEDLVRPTRPPATTPAPRHSGMSCFTAKMRVSTPRGLVAFSDLREGDWVYSFDLETRRLVPSRITRIAITGAQPYGILNELETPIEVTARHRFYARRTGFAPLASLEPRDRLLRLNDSRGTSSVTRGCYVDSGQTAAVYEISLGEGPHNYFVEGILVHNIKING